MPPSSTASFNSPLLAEMPSHSRPCLYALVDLIVVISVRGCPGSYLHGAMHVT